MRTMTIRMPDEKHERLKALASRKGVSLNKLIEEFSTIALTEFDAETRFQIRAKRGDRKRGLELLAKLDKAG
jgi:predicted DNA-binding protein